MASLKDLIVNGVARIVGKVYSAGGFVGNLTGNVTGNVSGSSGSCTGSAAKAYSNAYCSCSTAAATAAKTVTSDGSITLVRGRTILMYNTNANTATGALTLNVDGTGAKTLIVNGSSTTDTTVTTTMTAGYYTCVYDGTNWRAESAYETPRARQAHTVTNNTLTPNSTWYNVLFGSSTVRSNSNIRVYDATNGTDTKYTYLLLGNATATGTSGNKSGRVRLYGAKTYYTDLQSGNTTANRTITLPDATGTLLSTADLSLTQIANLKTLLGLGIKAY